MSNETFRRIRSDEGSTLETAPIVPFFPHADAVYLRSLANVSEDFAKFPFLPGDGISKNSEKMETNVKYADLFSVL